MGIIETSAALGACLLVLTIAVVLDRRPYRPGKRNYIPVMIIALAASLVLGRHLLSLLYMFAVGTPISERPRTDPSEPNSGTRLLPRVSNGKAQQTPT